MCGIAGFIDTDLDRDHADQLISSMCHVIRHRGPDDQGIWLSEGVALGMRRLAIIDVAGSQQPMFNEDQSIGVVFNGEIYNYRSLRSELEARGHHFQTSGDTETIVHAYEEFGDDCPKHLRGMFAFALWDRKRGRLLAARDRFGKKPLNYYWDGRRLIFGSEIKSILQAGIPRQVNPQAIDEYLIYGYVPTPLTMFTGVSKLPSGSVLIFEGGRIEIKRYWDLPFAPTCQDDEATATARIRALLQDAVDARLMSEVPLGAFLSGGVDSSLVVGLMSQTMSQPVKTFSIGFEDDSLSELPYARQVAEHFGTDHHEFVVRPEMYSVLPELIWAFDEPFADQSMLPTYYVSKLAREFVTVVLSGDGGDELFGGYDRYASHLQTERVPLPLRLLAGKGAALIPDNMRGKKRLSSMGHDLATRYVTLDMYFPIGSRSEMYRPDFFAQLRAADPLARARNLFATTTDLDPMARMQYVDTHLYLPDDILVKVDKASMFNSLETRAPLLDQHLAEYVASLPSARRTPNGAQKYLLKQVAGELLPPEILTRPKQGFGIPQKRWFRDELNPYARELLDSPQAHARGVFEPKFVRELLHQHASTKLVKHSRVLWSLLVLELWFQTYMDHPPTQEPQRSPVHVATHESP